MAASGAPVVDFYLDTACPWSWRTSVWMREVMKVRDVDVHWKFFSLELVNKKNDPTAQPRAGHLESRNTFRAMVLARRKYGDEAVNKLYEAFGTAKHEEKKDLDEAMVRACIEKAGYSPSLLDEALADPTTETEYVDEHTAINEKGAFGVASLVIDGSEPVFGPVIIPVPTGEEAGDLWDHISAMSTKGYFFELKRTRQ
ncbi:MAG: DsbA family protein [Chloroflexi bacterium]|nr:DsbA family protein [Chloroflexota bacterium]